VSLRNEEILPAIIIVVEQVRAPAGKGDSRGAQTRLIRDIAKGAIAIVVKKEIALVGKIGDDNIRAAVIVEIAESPRPCLQTFCRPRYSRRLRAGRLR